MKAISKIMLLMAALTTAWGCSSDDEEMNGSNATFSAGEKPCWTVNLTGHEGRPDWTMPDPAGYESDMFLLVRLQDGLAASSSDDDCMAVLIDGECRGLTQVRNTADEGVYYYLLKIHGNNADLRAPLTLSYYSAQLKQLFTLPAIDVFVPERTRGFDSDYVPPLLDGCAKYPVQQPLTVTLKPSTSLNITPDDEVAVFVGDECRGAGQLGTSFTVFARDEGDVMQVRYYSARKGGIYSFAKNITVLQQQINYQMDL